MTSGFVLSLLLLVGNHILSPTAAPVGNGEKPVRPHNFRFLIQAVAKEGPGFFDTYHAVKVMKRIESQAAGTLVDIDGAPIPALFGKVQVIAKTGTESTRQYLQMLSNAFRADDLRRAADMSEAWTASIVQEIAVILSGVKESGTYHGESQGYAKQLHGEAKAKAGSAPIPQSRLEGGSGQIVFKEPVLSLKEMADNAGKHATADRAEHFGKIAGHHEGAAEALSTLRGGLTSISEQMGKLLEDHFKKVLDDYSDVAVDKRFEIKWADGFGTSRSQVYNELTGDQKTAGTREIISGSFSEAVGAFFSTAFSSPPNPADTFDKVNNKINPFPAEVYDGSGTKATTGLSAEDPFDVEESTKLGIYITDLIAYGSVGDNSAEFDAFLKITDTSPAETMDRLSSTLNALKIRKSALSDAETSLTDLLEKIGVQMGENSKALGEKLNDMTSLLDRVDQLGRVVYKDAALYPEQYGVEIDYDGSVDLYDEYRTEVEKAREQDAIAEIHPRLNLLLNVAHRVHGHMLAFVRAVTDKDTFSDELNKDIIAERSNFKIKGVLAESSGSEQLGSQGVFTGINDISAAVQKSLGGVVGSYSPQQSDTSDSGSNPKMNQEEEKNSARSALSLNLQRMLVNARVASGCLLYGRYDVLMVKFKRNFLGLSDKASSETDSQDKKEHEAEAAWCGTTHAWGIKELRSSVIDHYTILGLDSNADADAVGKAVAAKKKRYEEKQQKALKETDNLTPNRYPRILDQITAAERELAAEEIADYKGKLDSHINAIAERIKNLATATSDGPAA